MKKVILSLFFGFFLHCLAFSQATVVVRNPGWAAQEAAKQAEEKADRGLQLVRLGEAVKVANDNLQIVKDATKKLVEINRKVANYRNLEVSIIMVDDALKRTKRTLKTLDEHNCFSPTEYRQITETLMGLVSQTSYAISSLTVVLTDNFSSMTDGERLMNMNAALKQLRDDMGVINAALIQIEFLDQQRMQIRTLKYLKKVFK